MKLLLDTHIWLWAISAPECLSKRVRDLLRSSDYEVFLSAASAWEISIKYALGKLRLPEQPLVFIPARLERDHIRELPIQFRHSLLVSLLPPLHHDPFDRLLIAQAREEGLRLLSADPQILAYGGDLLDAR